MRPLKLLFVFVVIALLSSALLPTYAQGDKPKAVGLRPDAPPYALHGPFWVGVREFVIPDKDGKRPLPVTVWYPALNPDGKPEEWTIRVDYSPAWPNVERQGYAIRDAAPDLKSGPYPLVVFSPGHWTARYDMMDYTEHLASHGFVAIAVDHIGDTPANMGGGSPDTLVNRPRDISRVIDYAESLTAKGSDLTGLIDVEHVAAMGSVFGGWTVLMSGGARWDLTAFGDFCTKNPQSLQASPGEMCGVGNPDAQENFANLMGLKAVPAGLWPSLGDPRVDAIVPLSPYSAASMFGQAGLKDIRVPVLLMAGSGLSLVPNSDGSAIGIYLDPPGYDTPKAFEYVANAPASLVLFENAGQWIFSDRWQRYSEKMQTHFNELVKGSFVFGSDPVWDMARAHDLINHFTTAFLLDVLKGDKEAHKALLPDAVKFVGIQYKTTMK